MAVTLGLALCQGGLATGFAEVRRLIASQAITINEKTATAWDHCKLIKCPERWEYYKEIPFSTLLICKKENNIFFRFASFHSSNIKKLYFEQNLIYIQTQHNLYIFEQDRNKNVI